MNDATLTGSYPVAMPKKHYNLSVNDAIAAVASGLRLKSNNLSIF